MQWELNSGEEQYTSNEERWNWILKRDWNRGRNTHKQGSFTSDMQYFVAARIQRTYITNVDPWPYEIISFSRKWLAICYRRIQVRIFVIELIQHTPADAAWL